MRAIILGVLLLLVLAGCRSLRGLRQDPVDVQSRPLVLSWEPFATKEQREQDPDGPLADVRNVTYEVRVYRQKDRKLVFQRRRIALPRTHLTAPLEPGMVYHWTVRPTFFVQGKRRVGSRSTVRRFNPALLPIDPSVYKSFRTPGKPKR